MEAISPVWPPAWYPWATTMSMPASWCLRACRALPASAATSTSWSWARSTTSGGGEAEGVGEQPYRIVEGDVELRMRAYLLHPAGDAPAGGLARGEFGYAVLGEGVLDELPVPLGDHRLDVGLSDSLHLLRRHDDVETVGLAVDVRLDPVEVAFEVVGGGVADRAEHSEAAGPADGRGDGGERREAEDGVLDSQCLAQLRLHGRRMPQSSGRRKRFSDAPSVFLGARTSR
ncbi:hypothetical protein SALBM311S_07394 [Streptomyces alboniger]